MRAELSGAQCNWATRAGARRAGLNLTSGARSSVAINQRSGTGRSQPLDQVAIDGRGVVFFLAREKHRAEARGAPMATRGRKCSPCALWSTMVTREWTCGRGGGWETHLCTQGRRGRSEDDAIFNSLRLGFSSPPRSTLLLSFPL